MARKLVQLFLCIVVVIQLTSSLPMEQEDSAPAKPTKSPPESEVDSEQEQEQSSTDSEPEKQEHTAVTEPEHEEEQRTTVSEPEHEEEEQEQATTVSEPEAEQKETTVTPSPSEPVTKKPCPRPPRERLVKALSDVLTQIEESISHLQSDVAELKKERQPKSEADDEVAHF